MATYLNDFVSLYNISYKDGRWIVNDEDSLVYIGTTVRSEAERIAKDLKCLASVSP